MKLFTTFILALLFLFGGAFMAEGRLVGCSISGLVSAKAGRRSVTMLAVSYRHNPDVLQYDSEVIMAHLSNHYRNPNKRKAFERALELVQRYTLDPGAHLDLAKELHDYDLTAGECIQVAAHAVRVERGRRKVE